MKTQITEIGYSLSNKEHTKFLYIDGSFVYQVVDSLDKATIFHCNKITLNMILDTRHPTFMQEYLYKTLELTEIINVAITYKILEG